AGLTGVGRADVAVVGARRAVRLVRVLAGDVAAVTLVVRALVAVVGARGAGGLLGVGRAGGAAPRAVLRQVALAGRAAAHHRRRLEGIRGTGGRAAGTGLGDVAGP